MISAAPMKEEAYKKLINKAGTILSFKINKLSTCTELSTLIVQCIMSHNNNYYQSE